MQEIAWPTPMKDFSRTGFSEQELSPPLRLGWRFQTGGYVWAAPAIAGGRVFVPAAKGVLYALDLVTGEVVWQEGFVKAGMVSATVMGDYLLVCGEDALCCFDVQSGMLKGKSPSNGRHSTPCVVGDHVFWGDIEGHLNAARIGDLEVIWRFDTGGISKAIPSTDGSSVYFSSGKTIFALDALSGNLNWSKQVMGHVAVPKEPTCVVRGVLYVGVTGVGLLALDAKSGRELWTFPAGSTPISVDAEAEVAYIAQTSLYAVNLTTGEEIWRSEQFSLNQSAPIIVGDNIFIGGGEWRKVYAFDRRSGASVWEYPTEDLVYSTPAYANGRLVIGSHDGNVYCFEEA